MKKTTRNQSENKTNVGGTIGSIVINRGIILQTETKSEFLGRIYSLKSLGSMISMSAGMFLGGIIIENIPAVIAFFINSVLFAGLTVFMVKAFLRGHVIQNVDSVE